MAWTENHPNGGIVFCSLIEIAVINAFVIYVQSNEKIPLIHFRQKVVQGLFTKASSIPKPNGKKQGKNVNQIP